MALTSGSRIGPYEILSALGAGGMGEVYRARDSKLGRDVALKIISDTFALDADRVARFKREAQVLASLNDPHIAAIYGFEDSGDTHALVLELVEGETLADRIARGPIPLDEALPIARQIAEALEAAHEQGIIHRDLKPANIKVTPDGVVKVLDFGLAKLTEAGGAAQANATGVPGSAGLSLSPTITSPAMMTGMGMLLGTAAYMSPEQAKGRPADKRSDVWAFGCVLFEMLTAKRAFEGSDVSDTLASVLRGDPNWAALPAATPIGVRRLLRRALAKSRAERLADAADARLDIVEALTDAGGDTNVAADARTMRNWLPWGAAAVCLLAALGALAFAATLSSQPPSTPSNAYRASLPLVTDANTPIAGLGAGVTTVNRVLAVSPDGKRVAFVARGATGAAVLWVRRLDGVSAQPVGGTENAAAPFWSPDSQFIAFFLSNAVKKIAVAGGPPTTIADFKGVQATGTWSSNGLIVLSDGASLFRVPASGGKPLPLKSADATTYTSPYFLPDGNHLLYRGADFQTYVRSLDGHDEKLLGAGSNAQYANGRLVFNRGSTLMAQPIDLSGLELTGEAMPVIEGVRTGGGGANAGMFSASQDGVIVCETGDTGAQITSFDRSGKAEENIVAAGSFQAMAISPDGRKLVYGKREPGSTGQSLWITDRVRAVATRLTFTDGIDSDGTWSPDGTRMIYSSNRRGEKSLYEIPSNGGVERLVLKADGTPRSVDDWSPDGRFILYHEDASSELWALPLARDAKPFVVAKSRAGRVDESSFSPDGNWVAYNSDEAGRFEVYVTPFPPTGAHWQVSAIGGMQPTWRRDGRELFFLAPDGTMMAVDVHLGTSPEFGAPHALFRTRVTPNGNTDQYAPSADGQRFMIMDPIDTADAPLTAMINWPAMVTK